MKMVLFSMLFIGSFLFMEFWAWFSHKYIMHGFLWVLHKDHHIRDGRKLERNDWFAVMFGLPSVWLIMHGLNRDNFFTLAIGLGIALYGLAYFLFHDLYVHQRIRIPKIENRYLRATLKAHEEHHQKGKSKNFGFLMAPLKYYKEEFSKK